MRGYLTHWALGLICTAVWFWGDKVGIPKDAQILAASVVPGLLAHAVGLAQGRTKAQPVQQPVQPEVQS